MAERFSLYIPPSGLRSPRFSAWRPCPGGWWEEMDRASAAGFLILMLRGVFREDGLSQSRLEGQIHAVHDDIKVSPNSAKIQAAVASILEEEANKKKDPALHQALIEQAIRHFRRAIQIYPEHSLAWSGWEPPGGARKRTCQGGRSNATRHVVALEPDKAVRFRNIALTADKIGDFETALEGIRSYRRLRPADIEAGLLEASYLNKSGRVGEAIRVREEVARANPRNAQLWSDMACSSRTPRTTMERRSNIWIARSSWIRRRWVPTRTWATRKS